jgi:hypothetical protein
MDTRTLRVLWLLGMTVVILLVLAAAVVVERIRERWQARIARRSRGIHAAPEPPKSRSACSRCG